MCLGVDLLGSNFSGTFCASWTCRSISFTKLRKFSFIIFSNKFSISWSSSFSSWIPIIQMLACLEISQGLILSFKKKKKFLFLYSVLVDCLFLPNVPNHWFQSRLPSLHCWSSMDLAFIYSVMHLLYPATSPSILITIVLNCASDRLAISILLISFFWRFDLFFHLGHISLSSQSAAYLCLFLCIR